MTAGVPKRRYEAGITVSADTWEGLQQQLEEICNYIAGLLPAGTIDKVSGGVSSAYSLAIDIDSEQSPEKYQRELRAWREARRHESDPTR